jgi:hypothetical protein
MPKRVAKRKKGSGTDWGGPKKAVARKKKRMTALKSKRAKRARRRKAFLIGLVLDTRKR